MPQESSDQHSIPPKLYFKIGEVSGLTGVPTYVLRFWETEFKRIQPKRTPSGQRLYRKSDVELILKIKHLLYERKFTIEGARNHLTRRARKGDPHPVGRALDEIRSELQHIRAMLGD